jgi:hypothetical protein
MVSQTRVLSRRRRTHDDRASFRDAACNDPCGNATKEFERRVGETASPKGSKTALILAAIDRHVGPFQASDLQRKCPGVGVDLIRRILKKKRQSGEIDCEVRGPKSLWRKTDKWNLGNT